MSVLDRALFRLDADLRALRVEWALVGGVAINLYVQPRTTLDLEPDDAWMLLVETALSSNFSPDEIEGASSGFLNGSSVVTCEAREQRLDRFEHHPDPEVQSIVRALQKENDSAIKKARAEAERILLHGVSE